MLHLALYGSRHQDRHIEELTRFFGILLSHTDLRLSIEERFFAYVTQLIELPADRFKIFHRIDEKPDLVVSIGGDGTLLRVAKSMGRFSAPIFGINTGHLGFLSAFAINDAEQIINIILTGDYRVEDRTMLRVTSEHPEFSIPRYALNEVALLRRDTASMINIEASLNGEPLASYRGDGLIVSTPTGSTGYNLSVGGSIIVPTTPCFIVSPIAAHSLNMRPIVISDRDTVTLRSESRSDTLLLSLDGKATILPINATLTVSRAPFPVKVAMPRDATFITTLRSKLLWGASHEE